MNEPVLTRERILEAAEDVLRRYGPEKATVVDVARALGVSHGSVYRHFPSKAALREAVAEEWLMRLVEPLVGIVNEDRPAPERLRRWLDSLITAKQKRGSDDPEMFANYVELAEESREVIKAHTERLRAQLTEIIADGITRGEFSADDPAAAAQAVFDATTRFHNPAHAAQWKDPGIDAAYESVWALILRGLSAK